MLFYHLYFKLRWRNVYHFPKTTKVENKARIQTQVCWVDLALDRRQSCLNGRGGRDQSSQGDGEPHAEQQSLIKTTPWDSFSKHRSKHSLITTQSAKLNILEDTLVKKCIFYFHMFAEGSNPPILLTWSKSYECNLMKSWLSFLILTVLNRISKRTCGECGGGVSEQQFSLFFEKRRVGNRYLQEYSTDISVTLHTEKDL